MTFLQFKNGDKMPIIGLGTWKSSPGDVYNAIMEAINIGYRHFDCAAIYGNEHEIGKAFSDAIASNKVKREDLWVTSKLWNNAHKSDDVLPALKKTLNDLKLEYLDLYLIHWPVAHKPDIVFPDSPDGFLTYDEAPLTKTWDAMQQCVDKSLTKHIGVSNFNSSKIDQLINSGIKPEVNQVELHPYLPQYDLLRYCQSNQIHLTAYSPLGSMDRPSMLKKDNEPILLENETIKEVAKKHNASPAQVLIGWSIKRNVAVIPKSTNPDRLKENFGSVNVQLDEEDMQKINGIESQYRFVDGSIWTSEGSPYSLSDLWE